LEEGLKAAFLALFTFVFLAFSPCLQAFVPKVILLTSLDPKTNRPPLRPKSWNINEKLEKRFHRYLKRYEIDLQPEVIHFADQVTLFNTLTSEDVRAIIWVSHAGFKQKQGLTKATSIIDYMGRDLKDVFQALGPSVKFLGLVGCQGQDFIESWRKQGWPRSGHQLNTFSRSKRTDARKGLKLAMKALSSELKSKRSSYYWPLTDEELGIDKTENSKDSEMIIQITRVNNRLDEMKSVQVFQKKELITVLPSSLNDQVSSLKIRVNSETKRSDLKIVLDSGDNSLAENPNLGRLQFSSPFENHWKVFSTPDGIPFGVGTNIYTNVIPTFKEQK
jgi:hypothetical protein